jgi:hypothetical protein
LAESTQSALEDRQFRRQGSILAALQLQFLLDWQKPKASLAIMRRTRPAEMSV